jgi:polysaccharide export outer membrane protein
MNLYPRLVGVLLLAVLGSGLAGCAAKKDMEALRAFLNEPRRMVSPTEYRVMPPDILLFSSRHVSEINNVSQRVRPDGMVNLPLLGEIMVASKTPKEIEESIKEAARNYYQEVDATVQIVGYNSQWIYVFGQVSHPGPIPYSGTDTLLDVLAKAQPNDLAWKEHITLVRGSHPQTGGCAFDKNGKRIADTPPPEAKPGDAKPLSAEEQIAREAAAKKAVDESQPHILVFNLMDMVEKGDLDENVMLLPNDVVYVEPTLLAKIGLKVQQLLLPIRPVAETATTPAAVANPYSTLLTPGR